MYKLLKNNLNFRYFYLGGAISVIGDYLYDIAVTLLVYDITKSVNSIAFMWIAKGALRIFVQYLAGIITDRYNRKKVIFITNLVSVPISMMLIGHNYTGIWIIYLSSFLLQALNDIDTCSEVAIIPEIVSEEELTDANTIFSLTGTILTFISLALSSLIYIKFGADILFLLNAFSFLLASLFFGLVKYESKIEAKNTSKLVIFDKEVFNIINKTSIVKYTVLTSGILAVISRLYDVYNIAIADVILGIGSEGIIFFRYAMVIGGLVTPLVIKRINLDDEVGKYLLTSEIIVGLFIILPFLNSLLLVLIDLTIFALILSIQGILFRNILQKYVDNKYIGRVFSMYKIILTLISLLTVGIVTFIPDKTSISLIFSLPGIVILLALIYCNFTIKHKKISNKSEF